MPLNPQRQRNRGYLREGSTSLFIALRLGGIRVFLHKNSTDMKHNTPTLLKMYLLIENIILT